MYEVSRNRVFSASHQLRGYKGRCERLHGHNWKVRVHVASDTLDESGMVVDFHELDQMMADAIAPFEHQHLNDIKPFDELNPSAENLAKVICDRLTENFERVGMRLRCCDVWENESSRARYFPDGGLK